jgi:hypothetical protein
MAAQQVVIDCSKPLGEQMTVQADTLLATKPVVSAPFVVNPIPVLWDAVNADATVPASVKALLKSMTGN